jgi:signal transduction histidine kinase
MLSDEVGMRTTPIPAALRRCTWLAAVLAVSTALPSFGGAAAKPPPEPLASVAAIRRLVAADLHRDLPAVVRGTVTVSGSFPVIQDDDAALEIDASSIRGPDGRLLGDRDAPQDWPPLGMVVEVEGRVASGGFAPLLRAARLEPIGQADLPPARRVTLNALFNGHMVCERVEVEGVVQGLTRESGAPAGVVLAADGRSLLIRIHHGLDAAASDRLIDAEVKVVGVMLPVRNAREEFVAPWLTMSGTGAIEVVVPPPADPFAAPEVPLESIARYRGASSNGHRIRCRGTVTYASANTLYLQNGDRGVRVEFARGVNHEPLAVGDLVEVAGFVDMSRLIGGLSSAVCRRIGSGAAPQPVQLGEAELFAPHGHFHRGQWASRLGLYDGRLIRCRAVVGSMLPAYAQGLHVALGRRDGPRAELVLAGDAGDELRRRLPPESVIDVESIVQIDLFGSPLDSIGRGKQFMGQVRLLVRRPEDVVVVQLPPWWTPRRLAVAIGGLVAAVAAAATWVAFLRREVRRQTARAVAEESARQEAAVQHEAALRERSLIAADLHDTLLQTLTGIGYQLHVCRAADGDESPAHLSVAARLVDHASAQLRNTVWSLRAMPDARQPFAESVSHLVDLLTAGHPIAVDFRAAGARGPIHDLVAREMLLVVQEAVSNAVHHGNPRRLDVSVAVATDAVELAIRDDGCGFTAGEQPGPVEGHFGIVGMQERVARLGGTIDITSAHERGTAVVVRVPEPFRPPAVRNTRFAVAEERVR